MPTVKVRSLKEQRGREVELSDAVSRRVYEHDSSAVRNFMANGRRAQRHKDRGDASVRAEVWNEGHGRGECLPALSAMEGRATARSTL